MDNPEAKNTAPNSGCGVKNPIGAEERSRTSTGFLPHGPEPCASAIPPLRHGGQYFIVSPAACQAFFASCSLSSRHDGQHIAYSTLRHDTTTLTAGNRHRIIT